MSNERVVGGAAVTAVVVVGLGWFAPPMMQSARQAVESRTAVQVERARRLLHQYDPELAYRSLLAGQLVEQGVEVDPQQAAELADAYQEIHASLWSAHQPVDLPRSNRGVPTGTKANYGAIGGQIRDGLKDLAALASKNEKLLDEALDAVDDALNVTVGSESADADVEANRLKATALYYKALAVWQKAQLHRLEAAPLRRRLRETAIAAAETAASTKLVSDSRIEAPIAYLQEEIDNREAAGKEDQVVQAGLDQTIRQLEARVAAARLRRQEVTDSMGKLKHQGVNFADPKGAERFAIQLTALSEAYREAEREIHGLTRGTFPTARIDLSGDYLSGRYLESGGGEPTIEHGVDHYRNERAVFQTRLDGAQADLEALRLDLARLEGMKSSLEQRQAEAVKRLDELSTMLAETHGELNRIESEAFTFEESALKLLDQAAITVKQAGQHADEWVSQARQQLQTLSPAAQERSAFTSRQNDGWMVGFTAAQEADAWIARASVYYDRYRAAVEDMGLIASIPPGIELEEVDGDAEKAKASQAREAGVQDIKKALKVLEQAHAKSARSWTMGAQAAGAAYLLSLFDLPQYQTEALEAYRAAIKGREDQPASQPFLARISRLEKRK